MKKMNPDSATAPPWNGSSILTRPPPANSAPSATGSGRRTGTVPILRLTGRMTHVNRETGRIVNPLSWN